MSKHLFNEPMPEPRPAEPPAKTVLTAHEFKLVDSEGRERVSMTTDKDIAMLAFSDSDGEPSFSIAVDLRGFVLMSANHRTSDRDLDSTFTLMVSNGEPEITLKDALFGDCITLTTRGLNKGE